MKYISKVIAFLLSLVLITGSIVMIIPDTRNKIIDLLYQQLDERYEETVNDNKAKQAVIDYLTSQLGLKINELDKIKDNLFIANTEIIRLENNILVLNLNISELTELKEILEQQKFELEGNNETIEGELQVVEERLQQIESDLLQANADKEYLQNELNNLNATINILNKRITELETMVVELQEQIGYYSSVLLQITSLTYTGSLYDNDGLNRKLTNSTFRITEDDYSKWLNADYTYCAFQPYVNLKYGDNSTGFSYLSSVACVGLSFFEKGEFLNVESKYLNDDGILYDLDDFISKRLKLVDISWIAYTEEELIALGLTDEWCASYYNSNIKDSNCIVCKTLTLIYTEG